MYANLPTYTTSDCVSLQTDYMWDAVARTLELDRIVDMDKLVDHIDAYLNLVKKTGGVIAHDVVYSVMSDYLKSRQDAVVH